MKSEQLKVHSAELKVDVRRCQRCGEDHNGFKFMPLNNPADDYHFYGFCPTNGQPVLMGIREVEEKR